MTTEAMFVTNKQNGTVQLWSSQGEVLQTLELPVLSPSSILCHQDDIFVSDGQKNEIFVIDGEGRLRQSFGRAGPSLGELQCPRGLAIDGVGRLLVADSQNHRVQAFDPRAGKAVLEFGRLGKSCGQFTYPRDLAVTPNGDVVVSDYAHGVQVFSSSGHYKHDLTKSPGVAHGVAVSPASGNIAVVNQRKSLVKIFDSSGTVLKVLETWRAAVPVDWRQRALAPEAVPAVHKPRADSKQNSNSELKGLGLASDSELALPRFVARHRGASRTRSDSDVLHTLFETPMLSFSKPEAVAFGENEQLYVTDKSQVHVFSPEHKHEATIGAFVVGTELGGVAPLQL